MKANIKCTLEPSNLLENSSRRPDGVTLVPWERGKCLAWDVNIRHSTAMSYLKSVVENNRPICDEAEEQKQRKYSDLNINYIFQPICFDTHGAVGKSTSAFLKRLSKVQKKLNDEENKLKQFFLWQRLSIILQKANAFYISSSVRNA